MQGSPERQQLEAYLKTEKAGSAKILALAHYAMRKDIEYRTEHRPAEMDEVDQWALISEEVVLDHEINKQKFTRDVDIYLETFDNAGVILAPYFEKYSKNAGRVVLDDLKEINREKSRK